MSRRPSIRKTDIAAAAAPFIALGIRPTAVDCLPSGGFRLYFNEPPTLASDDLDRELAEFEALHGQD